MSAPRRPSVRLAALLAVAVAACSSGTEPPTPTSVLVRTATGATSATLTAVGQTVGLTARVLDQNGDSMAGQTVTWSTGAGAVATVSASGTVTAVANGTAQIAATAGSATGSFTATVAQAASALQKQSGDAQTGPVATALGASLVVRVVDALGVAIPNAAVTWAVATGGGSVTGGNADVAGLATAAWTPGNTVGNASARATAGTVTATFTATLTAGPAAQITIVAGNNQTAAVGMQVAIKPKARVADQFGNIRVGHTVTWTAVGGSVVASAGSNTSSTTDAIGDATVLSWTMSASAGANSLEASAAAGVTVTFSATAATVGAPTAMAVFVGDNQTSLATFATNIRPAVRVSDVNNLPVSGQQVVFTPSAGGSVTGATAVTDMNGIAQVGSWTPGTTAGAATIAAAATGTALSATLNGTAAAAAYNIEIRNVGPPLSVPVQAAFDAAEVLWEQILYAEQPPAPVNTATTEPSGACGISGIVINETIDDIVILARFDSIDGPFNVLGQAGPCYARFGTTGLPYLGRMVFDTADVAFLIANGSLNPLILHEMAHVLGFSSAIFNFSPLACGQNVSTAGTDSYFNCLHAGATNNARAIFDSIGGTSYTGGQKVPLENCVGGVPAGCGVGQLYGHWREITFDNELMTPYTDATMPLSILTIATFGDLGYTVNYAAAQAYSRTFTAPAASRGIVIDLSNDEYRGPLFGTDPRTGRVLRVIRR